MAEALARMLAEEDLSDVKTCEGAPCTLMFADRTRGRSRRWCSREICGNRAKQTAHRLRLKESRQAEAALHRLLQAEAAEDRAAGC
jgi:predicted RNA-binding Zn ribbon-like protein